MDLLVTHKSPLDHVHNGCNVTNPTGRKNRQYTNWSAVAGNLLQQGAFILWDYTVIASVAHLQVKTILW